MSTERAQWVASQRRFDEVVAALRDEPRYAIDTEFLREKTYFPQVALVQIAWRGAVVLVDPLEVELSALADVLRGPGTAIVHAASQDLQILEQKCSATPSKLFDPQVAASFLGFGTASLGELVGSVLGVKLQKGQQLTNWLRRPLDAGAIGYAADDVAHLLALNDALIERLEASGRRAWAEEECERHRLRDRSFPDPETAWWKLKGKQRLSGSSRGIAQALAAWREREAQRVDRPCRTVLSDFAILGIAHQPPRNASELARVRGLDRGVRPELAERILAEVERGARLGRDELQLPPAGPKDRAGQAAAALGLCWAQQVAKQNELDPSVLGTRDDVTDFVRGRASRLDHGWRYELLGRDLRALCDGRAAIGMENGELTLFREPK